MADVKIEIFLINGGFRYSEPAVHRRPGTTVQWYCKDYAYGIQFANNASPFVDGTSSWNKAKATPTDVCTLKRTRVPMAQESYKYSVIIHDTNNNTIRMDDPIIIIDDEAP